MNRRLLFVGVSSMEHHAGQHKLYYISDILGRKGIPVTALVPDLEENRAFYADKPHVECRFYAPGPAPWDSWRKSRVAGEGNWSAAWVVGVGLRSFLVRGGAARHVPIIKDFDEFPSMISHLGASRRAYLQWIERRMIRQADGFTCASSFIELAVLRQRPDIGERLLRMPVAVSADEQESDPLLVRQFLKDARGRPILLYVGTVSKMYEDQLNEVIQLAQVLRRRGSSALIRIAGGGAGMEHFKAKAAAAGVGDSVEFSGFVRRKRDLASHMDAADVLLFPFPSSAFNLSRCPTKAYHYAAANRPVVTNHTGEVAALFGTSAFYYPENDVEAFADRCMEAHGRRNMFNNNIPFSTLTWEARAAQFSEWLGARGWLPAVAG